MLARTTSQSLSIQADPAAIAGGCDAMNAGVAIASTLTVLESMAMGLEASFPHRGAARASAWPHCIEPLSCLVDTSTICGL